MYIGERTKILIVEKDGDIVTIPRTIFNELKWKYNNGDRLFYTIDDRNYIKETYDEGIFNCCLNGETIQIRDKETIAKLIISKLDIRGLTNHITDINDGNYDKIWRENYITENKAQIVKELLSGFGDRIKYVKSGYYIDEFFKINNDGSASTIEKFGEGVSGHRWKYLCIVVGVNLKPYTIRTDNGNTIPLDSKTQEIIAKIMFCLYPNMKDGIFTQQLHPKVKKFLDAEFKKTIPKKTGKSNG